MTSPPASTPPAGKLVVTSTVSCGQVVYTVDAPEEIKLWATDVVSSVPLDLESWVAPKGKSTHTYVLVDASRPAAPDEVALFSGPFNEDFVRTDLVPHDCTSTSVPVPPTVPPSTPSVPATHVTSSSVAPPVATGSPGLATTGTRTGQEMATGGVALLGGAALLFGARVLRRRGGHS